MESSNEQIELSNEIEIYHLKSKLDFMESAMTEAFDRIREEEKRSHLLSTAVSHLMLKNELYEKMFERV
jgi:hypothetical protein